MNQSELDQIVKDFKDHCKKWPENVQGHVNALNHKLGTVEHGVDTSAAEQAIRDALNPPAKKKGATDVNN